MLMIIWITFIFVWFFDILTPLWILKMEYKYNIGKL